MSGSGYGSFETSQAELPPDLYEALGRALHRWSQLEAAVCAGAVALEVPKKEWLEAIAHLRGKRGFNVRGTFDQLRSAVRKWPHHEEPLRVVNRAEELYIVRQELIHGLWGHSKQDDHGEPAIHEWSPDDYDNYRVVTAAELNEFAESCLAAFRGVISKVIPFSMSGQVFQMDPSDADRWLGMAFHRTERSAPKKRPLADEEKLIPPPSRPA